LFWIETTKTTILVDRHSLAGSHHIHPDLAVPDLVVLVLADHIHPGHMLRLADLDIGNWVVDDLEQVPRLDGLLGDHDGRDDLHCLGADVEVHLDVVMEQKLRDILDLSCIPLGLLEQKMPGILEQNIQNHQIVRIDWQVDHTMAFDRFRTKVAEQSWELEADILGRWPGPVEREPDILGHRSEPIETKSALVVDSWVEHMWQVALVQCMARMIHDQNTQSFGVQCYHRRQTCLLKHLGIRCLQRYHRSHSRLRLSSGCRQDP
jgi:hypothetical protein